MLGFSSETINKINGNTRIVSGYFDLDKKEFVTKTELIERYPNPKDYYTRSDYFDEPNNEHQILWVYSKNYFTVFDAIKEARKAAFSTHH